MQEINTFISLLAVAISFYALIRTRMSENRRRQLEVEVHLQQYYSGVRNWAEQVIQKLTDAAFLCELDPQKMRDTEFFERRRQMRSDLSSLLDKGRLYLPNKNHEEVGLWKSGAYRGLRVAALDLLDRGYKLVESLDYENHKPNKPMRKQLVHVKREFTSEIQDVLGIRETSNEIRRLAQEIRSDDMGAGCSWGEE